MPAAREGRFIVTCLGRNHQVTGSRYLLTLRDGDIIEAQADRLIDAFIAGQLEIAAAE